jgi:hypothetical protein
MLASSHAVDISIAMPEVLGFTLLTVPAFVLKEFTWPCVSACLCVRGGGMDVCVHVCAYVCTRVLCALRLHARQLMRMCARRMSAWCTVCVRGHQTQVYIAPEFEGLCFVLCANRSHAG